jgi:hypothetical protein
VYQHIKTIEGLLFLKAQKNPKLAQEITMLNYYPSFFELPMVPPAMPMEGGGGVETDTGAMKNTQQDIEQARKLDQSV